MYEPRYQILSPRETGNGVEKSGGDGENTEAVEIGGETRERVEKREEAYRNKPRNMEKPARRWGKSRIENTWTNQPGGGESREHMEIATSC